MCGSHRLRLSSSILLLLSGCVAQPVPDAPTAVYNDDYWISTNCELVEKPVLEVCLKYHVKAGLSPSETRLPKAPTYDESYAVVDRTLAEHLKDPLSAMQYRIAEPRRCEGLIPPQFIQHKQRGCVCYSVNSKNSFGAYPGQTPGVVEIVATDGDAFIGLAIDGGLSNLPWCPALQPRDAELIKAAVR